MKRIWRAVAGVVAAAATLLTGGMVASAANAAEEPANPGSVTVSNVHDNQRYDVYQMLTLESDTNYTTFKYKAATTEWSSFLKTDATAQKYITVDSDGYVTWKTTDGQTLSDSDVQAFAQVALAYAKEHKNAITAAGHYQRTVDEESNAVTEDKSDNAEYTTATTVSTAHVTFSNLPLGYYLVGSTTGALVSLTTTKPEASTEDKNEVPTIDKQVQENSDGQWGDKNDAAIGETVDFKTTIEVKEGAKNYKLHDQMSKGLTFKQIDKVEVEGVKVESSVDTWQLQETPDGDDTFTVKFADAYVAGLAGKKIVVSYSATVNKDAVIAGDGNPNETWLDYGDNGHTEHDKTTTYVWEFSVSKYTGGEKKTPLAGAKFKLSTSIVDVEGSTLQFVKLDSDDNGIDQYRLATAGDENTVTEFTTPDTGKFRLFGLDAGTYYLTETEAPGGYNKLTDSIVVEIDHDGNVTVGGQKDDDKTVEVENKSGSELPTTGGMGTVALYTAGAVIVVIAALGLAVVLRKRQHA